MVAGVFFSYSHTDEAYRDQLEKQLSMLKYQGVIETWHDRRIGAGSEVERAIDDQINRDDIILLLVSPDFLASKYCYDIEMKRAMERHEAGEAIVIPVILRACDWHPAPFGKLNATPRDGKPITQWPDIDEAFLQVAKAVREAAERANKKSGRAAVATQNSMTVPTVALAHAKEVSARSSNLRLAKSFTQRDKDRFKNEAFEYMARFFDNSLKELAHRNAGIEGDFRRVDANRFFATVYKDGKDVAKATVYMGGDSGFGNGINYVSGHTTGNNSLNEMLTVDADDQAIFLTSMGMMHMRGDAKQKLSEEGASELYWATFIRPLQERR